MKEFTILKNETRVCDGLLGPGRCIEFDLEFSLSDSYLALCDKGLAFNEFERDSEEGYTPIFGFPSEEDKESWIAFLESFDFPRDLTKLSDILDERREVREKLKTQVWIQKELVWPLVTFLKKEGDNHYRFHEYFHNDAIVRSAIDDISNTEYAHELYRLLSILTYCWD